MQHPLYTGVGLLVLPSVGFLFDSWLGVVVGAVLDTASRVYSPAEEERLAEMFGPDWDACVRGVKLPWL